MVLKLSVLKIEYSAGCSSFAGPQKFEDLRSLELFFRSYVIGNTHRVLSQVAIRRFKDNLSIWRNLPLYIIYPRRGPLKEIEY